MSEEIFDNVWEALEDAPYEAVNMRARSELLVAIQETVSGWGLTQAQAASRLGVTQPRLNDLLRGRIDRFSLDALTVLASAAGLTVEWRIRASAA